MKSIVVYFSQMGNTKKIVLAIHFGMSNLVEKWANASEYVEIKA